MGGPANYETIDLTPQEPYRCRGCETIKMFKKQATRLGNPYILELDPWEWDLLEEAWGDPEHAYGRFRDTTLDRPHFLMGGTRFVQKEID